MLSIVESANPRFEGASVFYNHDYCWYFRGIIPMIPALPKYDDLISAEVVKVLRYICAVRLPRAILPIFHTILKF